MRPELPAILLAALLAGCGSLPSTGSRTTVTAPAAAMDAVQATQLNSLIADLTRVVTGTPTEQAEIMADARQDFEQDAAEGPAVLRYGLLLAAPAHPARNPAQAQQLLRQALARPELISPILRAVAEVELERVTAELRVGSENQRLVAELQQERERQRNGPSAATLTRQLQSEREQNALLRKQLDDARAKLDALAEFERRQADRPSASEGRNP